MIKDYVMNDAHSINYTLDKIKVLPSPDKGWVVGEPEIIPNPDRFTVTLKVKLTKYKVDSQELGRSL